MSIFNDMEREIKKGTKKKNNTLLFIFYLISFLVLGSISFYLWVLFIKFVVNL